MQIELKSLQREVGISFVFVTHDQDEAMALSDRIALLRAGELEQSGYAARNLQPAWPPPTPQDSSVKQICFALKFPAASPAADFSSGPQLHLRGCPHSRFAQNAFGWPRPPPTLLSSASAPASTSKYLRGPQTFSTSPAWMACPFARAFPIPARLSRTRSSNSTPPISQPSRKRPRTDPCIHATTNPSSPSLRSFG